MITNYKKDSKCMYYNQWYYQSVYVYKQTNLLSLDIGNANVSGKFQPC